MKKAGNLIVKWFFFTVFLQITLLPSITFADRYVKIYSTIDETKTGINQSLILTVTIETKNISKALEPVLPDLKPFRIMNKSSSSSTEISFINGKSSRVKKFQYQYTLKPEKIGKFIIGPVSVDYRGEIYKTEPIVITVTEKYNDNNRGYITDEGLKIDLKKIINNIYLKGSISKREVYVGEQIYLHYDIFSTYDIESLSIINIPKVEGFYKITLENPSKLNYDTVSINNKSFNHALLRGVILFPLFPGEFDTSPFQVRSTILIKSKEYPKFFALPYTLILSSGKSTIKAKPLPEYKGKNNFSGIVGSLKVDTSQHSKRVYLGESSKFYISLKSNGNLNNVKGFQFKRSLKTKIILSDIYKKNQMSKNGGYFFTKKFEYTIIPEKEGNLSIKSNNIIYFDTSRKRYISIPIATILFNVQSISSSSNNKDEITNSPNGKVNKPEIKTSRLNTLIIVIVSFFSLLTFILVYLIIKIKNSHNNKSIGKPADTEASQKTRLLLAEAESKLFNGNALEASSLTKKAIINMFSENMGIEPGKVTVRNIEKYDINPALKAEIINLLNSLNQIIYSQKENINKEELEKVSSYLGTAKRIILKIGK